MVAECNRWQVEATLRGEYNARHPGDSEIAPQHTVRASTRQLCNELLRIGSHTQDVSGYVSLGVGILPCDCYLTSVRFCLCYLSHMGFGAEMGDVQP
ncbi:hypothetical protein GCM10011410_16870 [Hoyosella rhizosphaerae]|uniref:Uncharacterized protein n=1 Tax=Hoyosella rhizosphaerae TaxID=1755582 RepID=A0A916U994_9ACTN|nr:hypothetical protein GCM10011410_16870 [Hoyosella rhizosphaerae]